MANQEQVDRLRRGVKEWNRWRRKNPEVGIDLISAKLFDVNLSDANLSDSSLYSANLAGANLNGADLSGAALVDANLSNADLRNANLSYTNFSNGNLNNANLSNAKPVNAYFNGASLIDANLKGTHLYGANFRRANLSNANFSYANLRRADLEGADLNNTNFYGANLIGTNLTAAQALGTNFYTAILTGACIQNWNINSETKLQDAACEYIFTKYDLGDGSFTDRVPHDSSQNFAPGEFTKRYQIVLETVNLFFSSGIDWKAFLTSLQELQNQYGDELSIYNMGKRAGGAFLVQLEVPSNVDKGAIERQARELYQEQLQRLEAQYRSELHAKDREIEIYKQKSADILELAKLAASRPITVEAKAVAENQSSSQTFNNNMQGATIGNFANTMQDQSSMQTTQYIGAKLDEVAPLIHSLRGMAETFPLEQRQETIDHLDDLEADLKQPPEKRKPHRAKAVLLALMATATAVSGAVTGANEFVTQTQELAEKLGIPLPIEQVEP